MKLLSVLMPRERHFFTLFNRHASLVVQGSKTLIELLSAYDNEAQREQLIGKIQAIEKSADEVTRETVGLMHTTFVTPFDRDYINRLITRMDDILDLIQDTAESMTLYDIRRITPEAAHLGNLVDLCAGRVQVAVGLLSSMDNGPEIIKVCQEIDVLESDADRVMRGAVSRLFREEADVRELIKQKAVYELLETTTDKCHDVGKVIEVVVLENG